MARTKAKKTTSKNPNSGNAGGDAGVAVAGPGHNAPDMPLLKKEATRLVNVIRDGEGKRAKVNADAAKKRAKINGVIGKAKGELGEMGFNLQSVNRIVHELGEPEDNREKADAAYLILRSAFGLDLPDIKQVEMDFGKPDADAEADQEAAQQQAADEADWDGAAPPG